MCEGCNTVQPLATLRTGTAYQPALCVDCEARLRIIGLDRVRLAFTIDQLLRRVPMEKLSRDLAIPAIESVSNVIFFARRKRQKEAVKKDVILELNEAMIPNDLAQRVRLQTKFGEGLKPDYAGYDIRMEDKLILHGCGVSWNKDDEKTLPEAKGEN